MHFALKVATNFYSSIRFGCNFTYFNRKHRKKFDNFEPENVVKTKSFNTAQNNVNPLTINLYR